MNRSSSSFLRHHCLGRAIAIIGSTSSFDRHHWSAQRIFRRARRPEIRTVVGAESARKNVSGGAITAIVMDNCQRAMNSLGIEPRPLRAESQSTVGNDSESSPVSIADLEDLVDDSPGLRISRRPDAALILVCDRSFADFQLSYAFVDARQQIHRFEARHNYWQLELPDEILIGLVAGHCADVPSREKSVHPAIAAAGDEFHCGLDPNMRTEQAEICQSQPIGLQDRQGRCGSCGLEADRKEDNLSMWFALGNRDGIGRRINDANIAASRATLQ